MSRDVDAVIAALKIVLEEAQKNRTLYMDVDTVNRWVNQLPGAWTGRWRHLKLSGGSLFSHVVAGHVRATLAYLEANREAIKAVRPWSFSFRSAQAKPANGPIDAEFAEILPAKQTTLARTRKSMRLIK